MAQGLALLLLSTMLVAQATKGQMLQRLGVIG